MYSIWKAKALLRSKSKINSKMDNHKVILACKTLAQLKTEYGVSVKTLKKMLRKVPDLEVDNRDIREFTPKEVEKIYRHLGVAGDFFEE